MKRSSLLISIVFLLSLLVGCSKDAPPPLPLTGKWLGTNDDGLTLILNFEQVGDGVSGTLELQGDGIFPVTGVFRDGQLMFSSPDQRAKDLVLGAVLAGDRLNGTWQQKYTERSGTWSANRQP